MSAQLCCVRLVVGRCSRHRGRVPWHFKSIRVAVRGAPCHGGQHGSPLVWWVACLHTPCADPVCCIAPLHCIPTSLVRPTIQLHSRAEPDQRVEYRRAQDARGREGAGELQRCARIPVLTNSDPCPATRVDRSTLSFTGCIACALYAITSDSGSVFFFPNLSQMSFELFSATLFACEHASEHHSAPTMWTTETETAMYRNPTMLNCTFILL